ncbi:hypothetical protein LXL04_015734 [Taraxacum kok-saghyz]
MDGGGASRETGIINLAGVNSSSAVDLTDQIHQLPCCIKYDGPSPVSHYFKPKPTGIEVDGVNVKDAYFRGRKLQGTTVAFPDGYSGIDLNSHLFCFPDLGHSSASGDIEVGPWGGKGGYNPFSHRPEGRISEIRLRTGGCVDSIRITRTDASRTKHHSETYGGDGGSAHTITFADDEYLIGISGTVGTYVGITVITSLAFQTNKKTTEHYGTFQGTSFSLSISKGHIVGFTGNYGDFLDSFGLILHA